ncbi:MAG: hypothetical protein B6A08_20905, partial [Sorangiineae bacterium NIC37A_2]
MNRSLKTIGFLGIGLSFVFGGATGCDDPFAKCEEGFDCPGDDEGYKSGGTSNSGGKSNGTGASDGSGGLAGGTSNSGGAGNAGGGSNPSGGSGSGGENLGGSCGDNCTDEKPHCIEDEATCVECTKHAHCDNPAKPVCGLKNTCDPCRTNADCKDVLGLTDTPVCVNDLGLEDFGSCVGCLSEADCGGNICDPTTKTCLELPFRKKSLCAPCEHDLECKVGQMCVEQVFNDPVSLNDVTIGSFCTWTKAAVVGPSNDCADIAAGQNEDRPFVRELSAQNAAGETMDFCVLRTTTCPAYSDHS